MRDTGTLNGFIGVTDVDEIIAFALIIATDASRTLSGRPYGGGRGPRRYRPKAAPNANAAARDATVRT